MSATDVAIDPNPTATDDDACPACTHPRDSHDRISQRFCEATSAGQLDRGCVCPAKS
ncbi:RGCVC family protein [Nocardia sp. NPDC050712]|uniref:RGCVC family protein n=1 Tax=Nocardia sp. NPDC050712 TaxID=3155518 RepID=UPI0033CE088D